MQDFKNEERAQEDAFHTPAQRAVPLSVGVTSSESDLSNKIGDFSRRDLQRSKDIESFVQYIKPRHKEQ